MSESIETPAKPAVGNGKTRYVMGDELHPKIENPDAPSKILTLWKPDKEESYTQEEQYLGGLYNRWVNEKYAEVKSGRFRYDEKGNRLGPQIDTLQQLKKELVELHDKLKSIPPELITLLVRDTNKSLYEIPRDELDAIIESINSYDEDWNILREPDPENKDRTLISINGHVKPILDYHGNIRGYNTSIPDYVMESATLHPEWKKTTQEVIESKGEIVKLTAYSASVPTKMETKN